MHRKPQLHLLFLPELPATPRQPLPAVRPLVALDERGLPSFNLLQNHGSSGAPLAFYVFDVMILSGENVMKLAFELNHAGVKMDEAIVTALKTHAAPRKVRPDEAAAVLEAAQQLFKEGRKIAEAFEIAVHRALPKILF